MLGNTIRLNILRIHVPQLPIQCAVLANKTNVFKLHLDNISGSSYYGAQELVNLPKKLYEKL